MDHVTSTRLRFVKSKDEAKLSVFIENIPFKVEIKSIVPVKDIWTCWFVIPDEHKFNSQNLD